MEVRLNVAEQLRPAVARVIRYKDGIENEYFQECLIHTATQADKGCMVCEFKDGSMETIPTFDIVFTDKMFNQYAPLPDSELERFKSILNDD